MKSFRAWAFACAVAAGAALAACGGTGGISTAVPVQNNTAVLRFVNGSTDSGAVDVYVDGTPVFTTINYGTVTPNYLVSAGAPHKVDVYLTGSTSPNLVPEITATYANGDAHTIALVGHQAPPATLTTQTFNEPKYTSTTTQFSITYHHASPNAPSTMYFGIFTPNPQATATASSAATATPTPSPVPTATVSALITPVPTITPFPAPTGGSFALLTTTPVVYGGTAYVSSAPSTQNLYLASPATLPNVTALASPQPMGWFATSTSVGPYCDPYSTCTTKLGPDGILVPFDLDTSNSSNTVPYSSNYHVSIFLIDATPPYRYQLTGRYD
jgi:hypothetical protein